jgi:CRISPR type III-B/RAMP module-associated protein Cmr5
MAEKAKHIEQERAEWALKTIRTLKETKDANKKELLSHIRKLPSHIQSSGLAQTLLFYDGKQKRLATELARHLDLLKGNQGNTADAVKELVKSAENVRRKTRDALSAAQWLKRFAEVELEAGDQKQQGAD